MGEALRRRMGVTRDNLSACGPCGPTTHSTMSPRKLLSSGENNSTIKVVEFGKQSAQAKEAPKYEIV